MIHNIRNNVNISKKRNKKESFGKTRKNGRKLVYCIRIFCIQVIACMLYISFKKRNEVFLTTVKTHREIGNLNKRKTKEIYTIFILVKVKKKIN